MKVRAAWGPQQSIALSGQHRFMTLAMLSNSTACSGEAQGGRDLCSLGLGRAGALYDRQHEGSL